MATFLGQGFWVGGAAVVLLLGSAAIGAQVADQRDTIHRLERRITEDARGIQAAEIEFDARSRLQALQRLNAVQLGLNRTAADRRAKSVTNGLHLASMDLGQIPLMRPALSGPQEPQSVAREDFSPALSAPESPEAAPARVQLASLPVASVEPMMPDVPPPSVAPPVWVAPSVALAAPASAPRRLERLDHETVRRIAHLVSAGATSARP